VISGKEFTKIEFPLEGGVGGGVFEFVPLIGYRHKAGHLTISRSYS